MRGRRAMLGSALVGVVGATLPAAGLAGAPGRWDLVTARNLSITQEVGTVRAADGVLHAAWVRPDAGGAALTDLVHTPIAASGAVGASTEITSDWRGGITSPAVVLTPGGGLQAFFGGQRTVTTGAPNENVSTAVGAPGGGSWTLSATDVVVGGYAYASPISATTAADGTPIVGWTGTGVVGVHRGAAYTGGFTNLQDRCCGYTLGLGTDTGGAVWAAWFSNADDPATGQNDAGIFVQPLDAATGGPVGPRALAPGSGVATAAGRQALAPDSRLSLVSRPGSPGLHLAYGSGYPTARAARIWRLGDATSRVVARGGGPYRSVNAAAGTDGRLWVVWHDGRHLFAARSNTAATTFGTPVRVAPPGGTETIWSVQGDGGAAVLDLLTHVTVRGGGPRAGTATWSTQVRPGLTFTARFRRVAAGRQVRFTVLDAGVPVRGARVRALGRTVSTNAAGRATVAVPRRRPAGRASATVTRGGYAAAVTSVRIGRR